MLLKAISDSDTVLMVSDDNLPQENGLILIGTEQIAYETNYLKTLYGCVRGANATTPAAHLINASLAIVDFYTTVTGNPASFTSITDTGLTASTALTANASKVLTSSSTTSTELGYVHGVTSAIQTQLNTKAPSASPVFTASFTLPVLTTTQRDALTATKGMLIYNSSTDVLNYYDGAWQVVAKV